MGLPLPRVRQLLTSLVDHVIRRHDPLVHILLIATLIYLANLFLPPE